MVWRCPENGTELTAKPSCYMVSYWKKSRKMRSRTTWMNGICAMMEEMGLTEEDWKLVTEENWVQKNVKTNLLQIIIIIIIIIIILEESMSALTILTGKTTGKIPLGRPRTRWEDTLE